jgi:hypothetical protein
MKIIAIASALWLATGCAATLVSGNPVEFELTVGETARLPDQDIAVEFRGVTADSRCPSDATCVWAGDAALAFRLTGLPGIQDTTLHTTLDPKLLTRGTTTLEVLGLSPTPLSSTSIDPKSYRVRLRVTTGTAQ